MNSVALEKTFQIMCSNLKFMSSPNLPIFEKRMDYKWVKIPKLGCLKIFELKHNLIEFFVGFQKIMKLLKSECQNSSYGHSNSNKCTLALQDQTVLDTVPPLCGGPALPQGAEPRVPTCLLVAMIMGLL